MVTCFLDNHRGTSTFSVSNVTLELFLEDSVGSGGGGRNIIKFLRNGVWPGMVPRSQLII